MQLKGIPFEHQRRATQNIDNCEMGKD